MKAIYILTVFVLALSGKAHSQWQEIGSYTGGGMTSMKVNTTGDLFFTTASYNYPSGQSAGIYRILNGTFLTTIINPSSSFMYNARTIETSGYRRIYASCWVNPSTENEGLYLSNNNGNSWTRTYDAGASNNIFSIFVPDTLSGMVFAGTRNGVIKSTNSGMNFTQVNAELPANSWVYDIDKIGVNLVLATSNGVYKSSNDGSNWLKVPGLTLLDTPKTLCVYTENGSDHKLSVGTQKGEILHSHGDITGLSVGISFEVSVIIAQMFVPNEALLSAFPMNLNPLGIGLYRSTDYGQSWIDFGQGLTGEYRISTIAGKTSGNTVTLYAGSFNGVRLYERTYIVGVNNLSTEIPDEFSLSQNYPNPFNPSTRIRFEVKIKADINIKVYDSNGKEVAEIVNELLTPGSYETEFNASHLSSGMYYYQFFADGNFIESRKMTMVK